MTDGVFSSISFLFEGIRAFIQGFCDEANMGAIHELADEVAKLQLENDQLRKDNERLSHKPECKSHPERPPANYIEQTKWPKLEVLDVDSVAGHYMAAWCGACGAFWDGGCASPKWTDPEGFHVVVENRTTETVTLTGIVVDGKIHAEVMAGEEPVRILKKMIQDFYPESIQKALNNLSIQQLRVVYKSLTQEDPEPETPKEVLIKRLMSKP